MPFETKIEDELILSFLSIIRNYNDIFISDYAFYEQDKSFRNIYHQPFCEEKHVFNQQNHPKVNLRATTILIFQVSLFLTLSK